MKIVIILIGNRRIMSAVNIRKFVAVHFEGIAKMGLHIQVFILPLNGSQKYTKNCFAHNNFWLPKTDQNCQIDGSCLTQIAACTNSLASAQSCDICFLSLTGTRTLTSYLVVTLTSTLIIPFNQQANSMNTVTNPIGSR